MDWSTVTTIGAGILDTIDYYTNYILLSWSSPIGLPNIIWQNVKQSYEALELQGLLGGVLGAGLVLGILTGGEVLMLGAAGYASEIFIMSMLDIMIISSLGELWIRPLVEKYGIDSIKTLHKVGVKFSDLDTFEIIELVEKYSIEIKDKTIADDILIESQKEGSVAN
jgi:hypothetical protein